MHNVCVKAVGISSKSMFINYSFIPSFNFEKITCVNKTEFLLNLSAVYKYLLHSQFQYFSSINYKFCTLSTMLTTKTTINI